MLSWRWCWDKLLGFVTPYQCCLNFVMIAFYVFKRCYYKFRIFQNDIAIINCVMQHDVCESYCSFDKNDQIFIFRSSYWLLDDKQNSKALFQETKSVCFISMHCITFYRTCRIFSSLWTSFRFILIVIIFLKMHWLENQVDIVIYYIRARGDVSSPSRFKSEHVDARCL